MIKQFQKLFKINSHIQNFNKLPKYNFTSTEILKRLRDETGSPIINVKKALEEYNGDFEKAKNYLIEKGLASAQKKLSKETREGVIGIQVSENKQFAYFQFNCETDFVARNELFQDFVNSVLNSVLKKEKSIKFIDESSENQKEQMNKFYQENYIQGNLTENKQENMDKIRQLIISKLQENINIRKLGTLQQTDGIIGLYVHNSLKQGIGGRGCLVSIQGLKNSNENAQFADNIALQILGMRPDYISIGDIPKDVFNKEVKRVKNEFGDALKGKNQQVVEKMVEGKMKKFYEENVLLEQQLLVDQGKDAKNIGELIKNINKKDNGNIIIKEYIVWAVKQ
ncbi:hypothetical protein IMG5_178510 [Ichthyophthirius multifiliis]|uniref:Elongation factor Ts, mitochondrial n=1 Tax=Ichthyophthirius multifiliis TaxID=5932 RepID=G0R2I6_ICHMU|nr:hypothetical protein IMG5_178510 [Ichthyophthirius multifiliis]EGR28319.1 hypothetical protein IMG5_178510 [Ichthyophthirius multifiliis]|eukprot:XP_004027664.1 hypothetical protein IMG5_178510 [Ichthyophthirius multifiliis]